MKELDKNYVPKDTEKRIYAMWEKAEAFKPVISASQKPFTIVIPPPNVTGSLHMGHALNNTIQDILIRRARMRGIPTLWIPGTDHAGIATQNVVEKSLIKQGTSRHELGREKFVEKVWAWVETYGDTIIGQLKSMGCSCDWSRQRFTMDESYSEAVKKTFIQYYEKGWIYRGMRVVNWCTRCQTALSDIEVEHLDQKGKLYYFKYDADFPITIATTRPETKLGDVAVAVNPNDNRYKKYIGQTFKVNFVGVEREIKIISDRSIDANFGTGAVGLTPAHSMIDAELAKKNGLDTITVIDQFGKMNENAGAYTGLKTTEATAQIIEKLKADGLLEKEEEIENSISVCYRCSRPIEPQPSKQWFVKMSELSKPAISVVKNGEIKFTPDRWSKVYLEWMDNLKDWCISRQIWWGHRLPVWTRQISKSEFIKLKQEFSIPIQISNQIQNPNFKNLNIENSLKINNSKLEIDDEEVYVGETKPEGEGWIQSEDVLDTWFSSALWPFATLGFPEETADLKYFYPTSVLSTARDILYLWVARMIFSGLEFRDQIPFEQVYIHPTIFNKEGKRMSKSLGTGVDPLLLIEQFGADATRFGLTYINTGIQDLKFDEEAIRAGGKFANKIWNISRFALMSLCHSGPDGNTGTGIQATDKIDSRSCRRPVENDKLEIKNKNDQMILDKLSEVIKSTDSNLDKFRFGQVAHDLYDFVWHDLADVYLEESKKDLNLPVLIYVITTTLKLLHPVMPFVTEEIWQNFYENKIVEEKLLITAKWPE